MADPADDDKTCPLCGGGNACAMAAGRPVEECWCWDERLDPAALGSVVRDAEGKSCLCAACGGVLGGAGDDR